MQWPLQKQGSHMGPVEQDRHLGFAPGLQLHSVTAESFVVKPHVFGEREDLLESHPL